MNRDDIDLEAHLGINADRLDDDIRRRLGEFVATRDHRLRELRERAIDAEQEVKMLQQRIEALQDQLASTGTAGREETTSITLDPATLVSTFGEALQSEQVQDAGFTVSNINVDLRANVVSTEEGVRVNLPEPGIQTSAESLSELRFSVRADPSAPDLDLDEVPDLIGLTEETASQTLSDAGFEVGSVETVPSDAEPGRVVDQLPSPFSLAESRAAIDLEIAEEHPPEMLDLIGQPLEDAVRFVGDRFPLRDITAVESEKLPGTIIEQDPAPGEEIGKQEKVAFTISAFRSLEPSRSEQPTKEGKPSETEEESSDTPEEPALGEDGESSEDPDEGDANRESEDRVPNRLNARLREAMETEEGEGETPLSEHDVTEINGIGDTYGQRLRDAGVESLADLAVAEPFEVADAANVSRDRAREWIDTVHTRLRSMTDSDQGAGQRGDEGE